MSRRLRWLLAAAGVVVSLVVILTARQGRQAHSDLVEVSQDLATLKQQLVSGDRPAAEATLRRAQQRATDARQSTHGPVWWLMSHTPVISNDVEAVRTVSTVSEDLCHFALPDVVRSAHTLDPARLRPTRSRVDLAPLQAAQSGLDRLRRELRRESEVADAIDPDDILPQIAGPVRTLQDGLTEAVTLSDRAARAARLLPPMLGSGGTRRYLLMFQNNAELRSTGGIPGSYAVMTADHGHIRIGQHASNADLGNFKSGQTHLTAEEIALFGGNPGRYPQDVNFLPDFARSGELLAAMWHVRQHTPLDGVMSVDPVALSYLLRGTGAVAVPGGRLTAENAVRTLLSTTYARIPDPARQDAYFTAVSRSVFNAVAEGTGEPRAVLSNLVRAGGERRILVWSRHPEEQRLLGQTPVGGAWNVGERRRPQVGVFLSDAGGSKLDYYLDYGVDVQPRNCVDGHRIVVTLRLHSNVPRDTGSLPAYVSNNATDLRPGDVRLDLLAVGPIGGSFNIEEVDGKPVDLSIYPYDGRDASVRQVTVPPGGTRTVRWFVTAPKAQTGDPLLTVTPGAHGDGVGTVGESACS